MSKKIGIKRRFWFGYKWHDCDSFYFRAEIKAKNFKNSDSGYVLPCLWMVIVKGNKSIVLPMQNKEYVVIDNERKVVLINSEENANGAVHE